MFPPNSTVTFIGSGSLAWHLAPELDNAGFAVKEVYSRDPDHAARLVQRLYQAEVRTSLDFSTSPSRVFVLAVSDDAIVEVAREIIIPEQAMIAHTSGSQPVDVLQYTATAHQGVFYPLQTFTKEKKVTFERIPIFVEGRTGETRRALLQMARAISKTVREISADDRQALHLAAVFASNFTNHMLTIAKEIMTARKLRFDWLKPLIEETVAKGLSINPEKAQTGPARRGDLQILDHHLELLKHDERLSEIYKIVSQHILDKYQVD